MPQEIPSATKKPTTHEIHNLTLVDDYAWLREKENPEVIAYLEAENAYLDQETAHLEEAQENLYQEMLGRIQETDLSVPYPRGEWLYYYKTEEGKAYHIHYRRSPNLEGVVILDENELAEGHDFFNLGDAEVSPDGRWQAYSTDHNGSEHYKLHLKDLETGTLITDIAADIHPDLTWANDNIHLYYATLDEQHRPWKLWRWNRETDTHTLIYTEADEAYFLGLEKTQDEKYLLMTLESTVTSEIWYLDADQPEDDFTCFEARTYKIEYSLEHHEGLFYLVTNQDALNFKLLRGKAGKKADTEWETLIPHDDRRKIDYVQSFKDHLIIFGRKNGLKSIEVWHHRTDERYDVTFPEPVYTVWEGSNYEYDAKHLRLGYSSLVRPASVFLFSLTNQTWELLKETPVLGGFDRNQYQSERIEATAEDGTKVPVSLVYHKSQFKKDGSNPLLLYAYGAYGVNTEPYFSSSRISLLDRGFVFAMAHVRGGGEMGRKWYEDGKFKKKINTFTDFIACARHLVDNQYTASDRLAAYGGSAGGLLVGAVNNLAPELFKVILAKVPFVDVLNTMLDANLPLTVNEWDEWGNPQEKDYFDYMRSYSPYDNVLPRHYPDLLVTAGLNDPRVGYWEPAKWVNKLREHNQSGSQILLKTNMGAGHQGKSGRYEHLREVALDYAFLLDRLEGVSIA